MATGNSMYYMLDAHILRAIRSMLIATTRLNSSTMMAEALKKSDYSFIKKGKLCAKKIPFLFLPYLTLFVPFCTHGENMMGTVLCT